MNATIVGHAARSWPRRRRIAAAAVPRASTALPTGEPVGSIRASSGSKSCATTVACTRSRSAMLRARRNHPRTVPSGTSSLSAIGRCPSPRAWANSAAPMTSTVSRRLGRLQSASKTVVVPQVWQRARLGRCQRRCPPNPRSHRPRPCPHGASEDPQPHSSRPAASTASTAAASPLATIVTVRTSFHGSDRRAADPGAEGATRVGR